MNRPVGASSTEVTTSANERFGNGSFWSGPTSVMFMPGMLGNVPGGSPAPRGGAGLAGGCARAGSQGRRARVRRPTACCAGGLNGSSGRTARARAHLARPSSPGAAAGTGDGPEPGRRRARVLQPRLRDFPQERHHQVAIGLVLGPPPDDLDLDLLALLRVVHEIAELLSRRSKDLDPVLVQHLARQETGHHRLAADHLVFGPHVPLDLAARPACTARVPRSCTRDRRRRAGW